MSSRVVLRQPTLRVDSIQDIVGDIEREIQIVAVVLDVSRNREVLRVLGWGELSDPIRDAGEPGGIGVFAGRNNSIELGSPSGVCIELTGKLACEESASAKGTGDE